MHKVEISVLLSVYQGENPDYLADALQSIANQTLLPLEVVLVIDGDISSPIKVVIEHFRNLFEQLDIAFKTPKNHKNLGLAISLNNGMKHCSYETIARMDTDDICKPERLEEQYKLVIAGKNFVYASSEEFENTPGDQNTFNLAPAPQQVRKTLNFRNPIVHPTVMYNKSFILSLGGYRRLDFFEDYDLWVRVFECQTANIAHVESPLIYFRTSRSHRSRRNGLKYFLHGFRCKTQWINEKRCSPLLITLSLAPFFLFSVVPIGAKEALYRFLRQKESST